MLTPDNRPALVSGLVFSEVFLNVSNTFQITFKVSHFDSSQGEAYWEAVFIIL